MMLMMLLSLLIHIIGSVETAANLICAREFESKTLIWPERSTSITQHVESRFWHKDDILVSWINEKGFYEGKGYEGRLNHVGDGNIEIKNVTRNDSGIYQATSKFRGVNAIFNASLNLQVIGVPARTCKPMISHEGANLKANLPSDDVCTTSQLRLEWISTNKTITTQNGTTILGLGTDSGEGEYMVCAVGEAMKCFQGSMADFCTFHKLSVPQHQQSGEGVKLHLAVGIPITLLAIAILAISGILWMRQKGRICKKSYLSKIRDYLQNHYGTMTDVSVSPAGKINVSVSEVFVTLELERIETRDTEDTNTGATPHDSLVSKKDANLMTQNKFFPSIMIIGDRGSGKSTWCKHLVNCWSHNSELGDREMQGLNLPPLKDFQILLYLPLKNSDKGRSFQALLKHYLFPTQQSYLKFITNHINGQNLSQSILIIIDGLDKISKDSRLKLISDILVSELSSCTYIFTSRPISFNQISDDCIDMAMKLYKICEMTSEKSEIYVKSVLNIINQHNNMTLNPVHFLTFTKYLHVECLLTSPYHCLGLLCAWMENKNPDIQMKDIIFIISEKLFNHDMFIKSSDQRIPSVVTAFVGFVSEIAEESFKSEIERLTGVERPFHKNLTQGSNMLEDANESGLITESPTLDTKEHVNWTFTNTLIYHCFVSYAVAFKKGPTFDYIASPLTIALKNCLIIHMICQFSNARGKEMFNIICKLKSKRREKNCKLNIKYSIKHKLQLAKGKEDPVWWLQNLLYKSKLDNQILLFVTDALKFTNSLSVLDLENLDNNEDLIFWLPFSKTLKVLKLNIRKCTLLLCPEWKNEKTTNLKEVVIKSMSIDESTRGVLVKSLGTCKLLTNPILPSATLTNITEIMLPRLDNTSYS
ncbi:hypothetical protein ACJMK2_001693 [Sinanodonta woodiana]|uniref:NACHT domain-containing protein n=1 Tax=Sinanodonta woodiana TaxID=1069815 RepID=A0ABD3XT01_SINWO